MCCCDVNAEKQKQPKSKWGKQREDENENNNIQLSEIGNNKQIIILPFSSVLRAFGCFHHKPDKLTRALYLRSIMVAIHRHVFEICVLKRNKQKCVQENFLFSYSSGYQRCSYIE